LTKLVIEGVFSETGSMRRAEATGISRDVGITATAIVGINNGLGMNMCKRFSRALLLDHKVAYTIQAQQKEGTYMLRIRMMSRKD